MDESYDDGADERKESSFSGNSDWITVTNADKVFTGTVNFANNDWTTITLTTPFAYDGTHNVAVIVDDNTGSSGYYSIPFLTYTGSPNQSIYYNNSSTNPDPTGTPSSVNGTQASSKNQIRVTFDRPDPVVCLAPTALAASGIRGQNATLSWAENGSATSCPSIFCAGAMQSMKSCLRSMRPRKP